MSDKPIHDYARVLTDLKERIRTARMKASLAVNKELLVVYWEIGKTLLHQREEEGWGTKIIDRVSADLKAEFPDFKGLSTRNLKYMRLFAEAYPEFVIGQQPAAQVLDSGNQLVIIGQQAAAQLPWGHHQLILDKVTERNHRLFYISKALENSWSRNVLAAQIESKLHERSGKALTNFSNTLPGADSDLATETFKNPYVFDFLAMSEKMQERDLERALISHLKNFMLELGKGFAYVGNQQNLKVDGDDYFLDLLFYNTHLHCYVVFELKMGEFKPEFAGKLNFYINTIDAQIKQHDDKPTIGVLLCKTPNETVVKFALQGISTPIGVSEYQLAEALPKQLKLEMPSIEELEAEIEKEYEELKNPAEKKMDRIKELMKKLGDEKISEKKNNEKSYYLFHHVFKVQQQMFWSAIKDDILPLFESVHPIWRVGNIGSVELDKADDELLKHPGSYEFYYELRLEGFKDAGLNTFSCYSGFKFYLDQYHYQVQDRNSLSKYIYRKLYHQNPSHKEMNEMVEHMKVDLLNQIEQNLERITQEKNE